MTYYDITYATISGEEYDYSNMYIKNELPFVCLSPLDFANFDFFRKEDSFIGRRK